VCNLLCCFFCVGPILFLVGFGMLVSSLTDYRAGHIENYNEAVEDWTSSGLTTLGNYQNTRNVVNVSMVFDTLPLSAQLPNKSTSETFIFDNDERVQSYSQFIRFETGAAMDLTNRCSQLTGCDVSPLASFKLLVNGQNIYHASVPAFTRVRTNGRRESSCDSGDFWDSIDNTCDAYSLIATICIKLQQGPTGWKVDNLNGGIGCGVTTWEAASYDRLRIYGTFPTVVYVPLVVRSGKDPLVAFYGEMGPGASNFGLTQGAKARTGTILLVIGGLILFFLCGTCFKLMRLDKHHRYYEEVRAPGMVYAPVQPVVYYQPQPPVVYGAPPTYPPGYQQPVYYQQGPTGQVPIPYAVPHQ